MTSHAEPARRTAGRERAAPAIMASIYAYLEKQSADDLFELYGSSWCCMAVFQSLPTVARHVVMRFLCIRTPIAESLIRCWYKDSKPVVRQLEAAMAKLKRLFILGRPPGERISALGLNGTEETTEALSINTRFAESLQKGLASSEGTPWEEITRLVPPLASPPSLKEVESRAGGRWFSILHFLIGSVDADMPEPSVIQLLVATGIMAPGPGQDAGLTNGRIDENGAFLTDDDALAQKRRGGLSGRVLSWEEILTQGGGEVHVTREGYGFLLRSTSMQLWTFLDVYVRTAAERGQKATDILSLLFELGYTQRGHGYAVSALQQSQVALLEDFAAFGLVYLPPKQDLLLEEGQTMDDFADTETNRFFPTHLAITLTHPEHQQQQQEAQLSRSNAASAGENDDVMTRAAIAEAMSGSAAFSDAASGGTLSLICESNFKLYGYTSAGLHASLLALFASIECLLPNLIVATITRRSVMKAYDKGITAEQIIGFLRNHLHPAMRARGLGLPENVAGQLVLWQRERHRMACRGAVRITGFTTLLQFRDAVAFARALKVSISDGDEDEAMAGNGEDPATTGPAPTTTSTTAEKSDDPAQGKAGLLNAALQVPLPAGAEGGLLWSDETRLLMCVRDGDYAEAIRAHMGVKAIQLAGEAKK